MRQKEGHFKDINVAAILSEIFYFFWRVCNSLHLSRGSQSALNLKIFAPLADCAGDEWAESAGQTPVTKLLF